MAQSRDVAMTVSPELLGLVLGAVTTINSVLFVDAGKVDALIAIVLAFLLAILLLLGAAQRTPEPERPDPPDPPDPWWKRLLRAANNVAKEYKELIALLGFALNVFAFIRGQD